MFPELSDLKRYPSLDGKTFVICVGAMKCATSWIHDYLGQLPGVVVSPLKELHFFDMRFNANALSDMDAIALRRLRFHMDQDGHAIENLRRRPTYQASVDRVQMIYDPDAYFGHFARLCTAETQTFCDITPAYSTLGPTGFEYMARFCASQDVAVKILFVMRDPVDRMWSQLRHMTQTSQDHDFTRDWKAAFRSPALVARADYRSTIEDIEAHFATGDIAYLFYEDVFDAEAQRRLCALAGAAYQPGDSDRVLNETKVKAAMPADAEAAAAELLANQYAFCRDRFGDAVPASWRS